MELSWKSDLGLPNSATDGSTRSAAVDASVYEYVYSYTSSPGWRVEVLDTCIIVLVLKSFYGLRKLTYLRIVCTRLHCKVSFICAALRGSSRASPT